MGNKPNPQRECPECGGTDFEEVEEEPEELVCSNCGLIHPKTEQIDWSSASGNAPTSISTQEKKEGLREFRDSQSGSSPSKESGALADYWHHEPAIFAIMSDNDTKQEFYRIDDPEEFFNDVDVGEESPSMRNEKLRRKIQKSDIEPFQKIEIPYIDWKFK